MLILTQDRKNVLDSDSLKNFKVNQFREVIAIPKSDAERQECEYGRYLLGTYQSEQKATKVLSQLFEALTEQKTDFKMPFTQKRNRGN